MSEIDISGLFQGPDECPYRNLSTIAGHAVIACGCPCFRALCPNGHRICDRSQRLGIIPNLSRQILPSAIMEERMKRFMTLAATVMLTAPFAGAAMAQSTMSAADQIAQAVSAAPESLRAGATVVNYDAKGDPVVLRQGTNGVVCTPDQGGTSYSVNCYGAV